MGRFANRTRAALTSTIVSTLILFLFASCAALGNLPTPTPTPTQTPTAIPTATPIPPSPEGFWVSAPSGLVSDTARNRLYVASKDADAVIVWDEIGRTIVNTIPVGSQPWGVALVNDRVFVANSGSASVSAIDAATMRKMTDIRVADCGSAPTAIAINPKTNRAYVAISRGGRVAAIDAANNRLDGCLAASAGTLGVTVNPVLNQLYVTNRDAMSLQVFDISRVPERLVFTEDLGGAPFALQANRSTSEVYVIVAFDPPDYAEANNLLVYTATDAEVSLAYATVIGRTEAGGAIWVSQKTGALYIAATKESQLEVLEPVDFSPVRAIPMPDPFGITENIALGRVYIGNRTAGWVNIQPNNLGGPPAR